MAASAVSNPSPLQIYVPLTSPSPSNPSACMRTSTKGERSCAPRPPFTSHSWRIGTRIRSVKILSILATGSSQLSDHKSAERYAAQLFLYEQQGNVNLPEAF